MLREKAKSKGEERNDNNSIVQPSTFNLQPTKPILKAIVLAAGFGNRLRPFTCNTPKPLLPVWGVPMLSRIVGMLREWGVEDVMVNCHYLHEQIEQWCRENDCKCSYEKEILGTGGVLNPLRDWIGNDDFYVVNGDIVVENVPRLTACWDDNTIATCLVSEEGPRTIEVEPTCNYVTNWKSDDAGWSGTYTYCGIALLRAEILRFVKPSGFSTLVEAYESAMMEGKFVKAVIADEMLWSDAGTIASYIDLNRDGDENAFHEIPQVREALGESAKVEFIGARGSERIFFKGEEGIVILYDDAKRVENARYAGHAKWLAERGAPVPKVIRDLPHKKTLVMENVGSERKMSLEEYVKVVEALVKFNALDAGELDLEPRMDADLWKWERELFFEHCLGTRFHRDRTAAVEQELENVSAILNREPLALVHRDFQSTNVLWKGDKFSFIDFQGMRLGPAAYDLASLVYDPYASLTEGERRALVALYAKKCGREEIVKILPYAAVQRLVQCLGAFGRLASVGQPQFGKFVLPALQNLLAAADNAGLDAVGALAEDLIATENHHACGHHHHHDHECHCHDHEEE